MPAPAGGGWRWTRPRAGGAEQRFSAERMVADYEQAYRTLLALG